MKYRQHTLSRAMLFALALALSKTATAAGWTQITSVPDFLGTLMQMTDGTIIAEGNDSQTWHRLTPDAKGNYATGTWTSIAKMQTPRLYFASEVLPSGNVWVLGGEYSGPSLIQNTTSTGEIYNIHTNTWSSITPHPEGYFGDDPSMLLDSDHILTGSIFTGNTYIYTISTNSWGSAIPKHYNDPSDEETWVKLPGGKILTYDLFQSIGANHGYAELFDPATSTWSSISPVDGHASGSLPVLSSSAVGYEMGAAVQLCDGRIFIIGAVAGNAGSPNTAFYTPSTNTWNTGPAIPGGYAQNDAPAAVLPNCHVILAADSNPTVFTGPTNLYDFDPIANTITQISTLPSALSTQLSDTTIGAFVDRMLMLPTGQLLFSNGAYKPGLWIYTPGVNAAPSLVPIVNQVTNNHDGSFTLTGQRITGKFSGSSYGDDAESDDNYPIVRLQQRTNVYYARTSNWSSTYVATGSSLISTNFCFPHGITAGNYTLVLSAAGLQSLPMTINIPTNVPACTSTQ